MGENSVRLAGVHKQMWLVNPIAKKLIDTEVKLV